MAESNPIPKKYTTPEMIQEIDQTLINYGTLGHFASKNVIKLEYPDQQPLV